MGARRSLSVLAATLLAATSATQAAVVVSRQVIPFVTGSVEYIQNGPSWTLPLPHYQQSQSLSFEGFDPSLGRLVNAYVSVADTYAIEYAVIAGIVPLCRTMTTAVGAGAHYEFDFGIKAPGVQRHTVHAEEYSTNLVGRVSSSQQYCSGMFIGKMDGSGPKVPDGTIDGAFSGNPWVSGGDLDVPIIGLADGLDVSGPAVVIELLKDIYPVLLPIFSSSEWPTYSKLDNFLNEWKGSLALTYVYETDTPGPIPEPVSLALVGVALAAAAATRRRSV
jgi:hypothetical protein